MSLQELISKAAKDKAEADANRVRDLLIDVQTKVFDRAAAYTNLIMFGGYAGAFAIWNFTRDHLTAWAEIWAALLLIISLVTFIFFEVFKMIFSSGIALKQRALLTKTLPPDQFVKELEKLGQQDRMRTNKWVIPLWVGSLAIAVPTALGAVAIFIWSFVTILLSGQQ